MNRIDEESPSSGMVLTSLNEAFRLFVPGIEFRGIRGEGYDSSPSPSGRNMGFLKENGNSRTSKANRPSPDQRWGGESTVRGDKTAICSGAKIGPGSTPSAKIGRPNIQYRASGPRDILRQIDS
jgi:hypothetical protein